MSKLYSDSSTPDTIPLRSCQRMAAFDAGYEAASKNKGEYFFAEDYFIDLAGVDRRVPDVTEEDSQFWEWLEAVSSGVRAY